MKRVGLGIFLYQETLTPQKKKKSKLEKWKPEKEKKKAGGQD